MAEQLGALASLSEDLGMATTPTGCNLMISSDSLRYQRCINIHAGKRLIHIKMYKFLKIKLKYFA